MSFLRRALFVLIAILAACSDREFQNPPPEPNGEPSVAPASTPGGGAGGDRVYGAATSHAPN